MIAYLKHVPQNGALGRELLGPAAEWSADHERLTEVVDLLAGANWQRGGGKSRRPKPVKRPKVPSDA